MDKAIKFGKKYTEIKDSEVKIIKNAAKSILHNDGVSWVKKKTRPFDITMGSYHGAEVCKLIGLYMMSKITINQLDTKD